VIGAGLVRRRLLERALVGGAERARHRSGFADVPREAAGVDAGDAGHAVVGEEGLEVVVAPPVAGSAGEVADDDAAAERLATLVVVGRGAVVADVRVGEGDDLPGVGRVRDHLLVAAHHGVEDDLAGGHAARRLGADGLALEGGAVGEDEQGFLDRLVRLRHDCLSAGGPLTSFVTVRISTQVRWSSR
jgi:hypothetical protein